MTLLHTVGCPPALICFAAAAFAFIDVTSPMVARRYRGRAQTERRQALRAAGNVRTLCAD